MTDRHRRFWVLVRRFGSGGSFLSLMAALGVVAAGIATLALYLSERKSDPAARSDVLVFFGLMAAFQLLIWGGMGVASHRRRSRSTITEDVALEAVFPRTEGGSSWRPPSLWVTLAATFVVAALELSATSSPIVGLLAGADTAIVLLLIRWAWPMNRPPTWRIAVVALYAGTSLAALQGSTSVFGGRLSAAAAVWDGVLAAGLVFGLALIARSLGGSHARLAAAFDVRDRALELATKGDANSWIHQLLMASEGHRVPLEIAREMLSRRRNEASAVRAVELIDQTIEATDWGPWPWSSAVAVPR